MSKAVVSKAAKTLRCESSNDTATVGGIGDVSLASSTRRPGGGQGFGALPGSCDCFHPRSRHQRVCTAPGCECRSFSRPFLSILALLVLGARRLIGA